MTSRVPGSSPGGSGVFSLFRQFTSPTDPLNLKFSHPFQIIIIIIIYYYYYYSSPEHTSYQTLLISLILTEYEVNIGNKSRGFLRGLLFPILTKYEVNIRFITTSQSLCSIAKKESNISGQYSPKE